MVGFLVGRPKTYPGIRKGVINKFKHKMMGYNIEFYPYLPKI